jgi:hypothetical protein
VTARRSTVAFFVTVTLATVLVAIFWNYQPTV